MTTFMIVGMLALVAMVLIGLLWRIASRLWFLPCPCWLIVLIEKRFEQTLARSSTLLDRAGVAPGMQVLDVGCGAGRLSLAAGQRVGSNGRVVALDIKEPMILRLQSRLAERGVSNVYPVLAGADEGKFEHGAFDRAFLVTVLGEIPDRPKAMREIYEALKPGGLLSVTEMLPDPHYQTRKKVRKLAGQAGLQFEQSFGSVMAFTMHFVKPSDLRV
jgi:ubiquinone/menaquinone biosynthesis C-methylase UbiE